MSKCTKSANIYEDIEFCQGKKSLPGLRNWVYGVRKADIVGYPAKPDRSATGVTLAKMSAYTGNLTLASDAKAFKVALVPNKNNVKTESQGEYGSKTFKNTVELFVPGTEEEATGLINELNNDEVILLVPQRNGKYRMIGSEDYSPEFALGQETGSASTDANQTTITATADDEFSAPFYKGTLPVDGGTLNCETGEITAPSA